MRNRSASFFSAADSRYTNMGNAATAIATFYLTIPHGQRAINYSSFKQTVAL